MKRARFQTSFLSFGLLSLLVGQPLLAQDAAPAAEPAPVAPAAPAETSAETPAATSDPAAQVSPEKAAQEDIGKVSTQIEAPSQPVEASGRELTLAEVIERAMTRSLTVVQSEASLDASREARRGAFSRLGPIGTVNYNQITYEDAQTAEFGGNTITLRPETVKTGSLVVSQPLTGLYGYIENARLNNIQVESAEEGLRSSRSTASFGATNLFLQAYAAEEGVAIAKASAEAARSSFNDAEVMNRVGRLNQADYLRFQLARTQAESRLAQAKAQRLITRASLRQAIQLPAEEQFRLSRTLPEPNLSSVALEKAVGQALADRSDLKQAGLQVESATFNRKLAYTQFIPTVDAFMQIDRNFGEVSGLGGEKETKYVGLRASWQFWNSGASVFAIREASSNIAAANAAFENAKDGVRLQVIQAVENLQAAQESLRQAQAGVKQAEEVYRIDQVRFKSGGITATDLILSESSRSNAQGSFVSARTELLRWYFELQRATGQEKPQI